ncbi:DUF998 domain-containing protein [Halosegnis longus]|uniref:DUF998 domain-containing protein n=1 Tax=Halosegnis longus TaxID=2216012 RepID=A0AAJ4R804_9EURY|nr:MULTISPECIES: DUF998 domain-containing protein [Halobacteriales]RNJ26143.1 DUF998 domain-containing protein [Salella cibi]
MNTTQRSVAVGVVGVLVSFVAILTAVGTASWFSWAGNALSDLGVSSGVARPIFNYGLVATGVIALGFVPALWQTADHLAHRVAVVPFVIAMVGVAGVGLFPSSQETPHAIAAITAYLAFMATPAVYGVGDLLVGARRRGVATIASALVHLGFWVVWATQLQDVLPGLAVPEFVGSTLFNAWVCYTAARLWDR